MTKTKMTHFTPTRLTVLQILFVHKHGWEYGGKRGT